MELCQVDYIKTLHVYFRLRFSVVNSVNTYSCKFVFSEENFLP